MKKKFVMFLTLLLSLSLFLCACGDDKNEEIGEYSFTLSGSIEYTLTLKEENKYSMAISGIEVSKGTYNIDGETFSVTDGTDSFSGTIKNGKITINYDGVALNFVKKVQNSIEKFTVSFETDGGSDVSSYTTSTSINTEPVTRKNGYIFEGWFEGENGAGNKIVFPYSPSSNITLYAKWKAIYTTTFDSKGGTKVNSTTSDFINTDPETTRRGYTFGGWYDEDNGMGNKIIFPYSPSSSITLYAKWTANTYTITYDAKGGLVDNPTAKVSFNSDYTLDVPKKSGYTFIGWYYGSFMGEKYTDENGNSLLKYNHTTDLTLEAKWKANTYTITCDPNGGEMTETYFTVVFGNNYTLKSPSKPGYTFVGFYDGENGTGKQYTNRAESITPFNQSNDITLYAKWTARVYTITYSTGGGETLAPSKNVTFDSPYTLEIPKKTGYTFWGWFEKYGGGGVQFTNEKAESINNWDKTENKTFYAKWTANTYMVTYDYQGATGNNSEANATVTYNSEYTLCVPTKTGYTFRGWYADVNVSETQYTNSRGESLSMWTSIQNITLYAKWTAI